MRITPRCTDILRLLRTARWLTTAQIQRRFFPLASSDAARKRLRKLTAAHFLFAVRRDRMSQAIFTIGSEGKRFMEALYDDTVTLERKPPTQLAHFSAINDLRIAAELAGGLDYFYSAWELPGIGWKDSLIPDGIMAFDKKPFALEFDTGCEGVQFFVRTKMPAYRRGLAGIKLAGVLIVTDRKPRMLALAKAIGDQCSLVTFTTLDLIVAHGFRSPVFYTPSDGWGVGVLQKLSSRALSSTREIVASNRLLFQ